MKTPCRSCSWVSCDQILFPQPYTVIYICKKYHESIPFLNNKIGSVVQLVLPLTKYLKTDRIAVEVLWGLSPNFISVWLISPSNLSSAHLMERIRQDNASNLWFSVIDNNDPVLMMSGKWVAHAFLSPSFLKIQYQNYLWHENQLLNTNLSN